jgi:hypothetical protein
MLIETFRLMRRNPGTFCVFFACLIFPLAMEGFTNNFKESGGVRAFMTFYAMMFVHKMVLADGTAAGINTKGTWGFSWRHVAILITTSVVSVFPVLMLGYREASLGLVVIVFCILYPLALSLVGIWPISALVNDRITLRMAARFGRKHFFKTLGRLFLALVVPIIASITLSLAVAPPSLFFDSRFTLAGAFTAVVAQASELVGIAYVGVVLTRKYLDGISPRVENDVPDTAFVA